MSRITLIAAQSLDGFIARPDRPGTDFCSEADAAFLRSSLQNFDSMIMGRKTYETLRQRIQSSSSTRFLRKVVTRNPSDFEDEERPGLIEFTNLSPTQIQAELAKRGRKMTALLGGGQIYTHFLASGLVEELWITIEPILFGAGTPLLTKELELNLQLFESSQLSETSVLLKYKLGK
ncbi:dihydrofolate reductase [Pelagicoccus albus]|uniref:Dihydrofolate reductase n=1 Tax=Pelagicoccus albus TaxID=415222 RepID=A0A7X1E861_9BACT|nr:dihydrofolate reductase [Pelagicoccus albus]